MSQANGCELDGHELGTGVLVSGHSSFPIKSSESYSGANKQFHVLLCVVQMLFSVFVFNVKKYGKHLDLGLRRNVLEITAQNHH